MTVLQSFKNRAKRLNKKVDGLHSKLELFEIDLSKHVSNVEDLEADCENKKQSFVAFIDRSIYPTSEAEFDKYKVDIKRRVDALKSDTVLSNKGRELVSSLEQYLIESARLKYASKDLKLLIVDHINSNIEELHVKKLKQYLDSAVCSMSIIVVSVVIIVSMFYCFEYKSQSLKLKLDCLNTQNNYIRELGYNVDVLSRKVDDKDLKKEIGELKIDSKKVLDCSKI